MYLQASKEIKLFCLVLHNRKIILQGIMTFPDKIFVQVCLRLVPAQNLLFKDTVQEDILSIRM